MPLPTAVGVPTSAPANPNVPACPADDDRPDDYHIDAALDYRTHVVQVSTEVTLSNQSGEPLTDLAFGITANLHPDALELESVFVGSEPAGIVIAGPWIKVILHKPLGQNCETGVRFDYRLRLPEIDPYGWGWRSAFGWTPRQVVLGEWYPVLTTYRRGEGWQTWAVPPVGEFQPAEASHVSVRLSVSGEEAVQVVGSAIPERCDGAWCMEGKGVRFFTVVVSDRMEIEAAAMPGFRAVSAYFPEDEVAGQAALRVAADSFEAYTRRFGPIDQTSMTIVEADFFDGMEYSGLAFVGQAYYAEYDGTPQNYLTLIVAHETAHQWWYGSVGNDPAAEPWLDEALATASELVYLNDVHPGLEAWWWGFRVNPYDPAGSVGSSVYDHPTFRPYVNAVYLRGARLLGEIRAALGDEAFFTFLSGYAQANKHGRVTADDFWQALAEFGPVDAARLRGRYFPGE